jgi:hypothetical protein
MSRAVDDVEDGAQVDTDVTTLDPANLSTSEDHELTRNIYQTLESRPSPSRATAP